MEYHRRLFAFTNNWLAGKKSGYSTRKNELAISCLLADRVRWYPNSAPGILCTGSTALASGDFPFRQFLELRLRSWPNALSSLTERGDSKPA